MAIKELELQGEHIPQKPKKKFLKVAFSIAGFFIFLVLLIVLYIGFVIVPAVNNLKSSLSATSSQVDKVKEDIKQQNIVKVKSDVVNLQDDLESSQKNLHKLGIVRFIPIVNGYYNDANHLITAAVLASEAGEITADGILPFSDVLGLRGKKSKTTAEAKTQFIVNKVIPSLGPLVDQLEGKLSQIENEVSQVDPYRYPAGLKIKGCPLRGTLIKAKEDLDKAQKDLPDVKLALKTIPDVLGSPTPKTYLFLFQNDKELRATGGFITAYAIGTVKAGKLTSIKSEDIYKLDSRLAHSEPVPDPLRRYLGIGYYAIRDTNLSPDFLVSAKTFESFYNRVPDTQKVDGIISIDTEFVRSLLEVTGPITVPSLGDTFSAENNQYGIPDVTYKLELYAEKVFRRSNQRKGFIGDLMHEIINKVLNAPPEKFQPLFNTFLQDLDQKHLQFYLHNKDAQALAEKFNFAGRIKPYDGDYLNVNNSNFGGLKANLFITGKIEQDIVTSSDGKVTKKVSVTLTNPNNQLLGWLNSYYRNWMRVYLPIGSKLINKQVQADFQDTKDLGKEVYSSFSVTGPLTSSVTSFTYQLPFKVMPGQEYRLLVQKQAGTGSTKMIIRLNGKDIENFDLTTDREIKFKI